MTSSPGNQLPICQIDLDRHPKPSLKPTFSRRRTTFMFDEERLQQALQKVRVPLALAPVGMIEALRRTMETNGVAAAVQAHDDGPLFDYVVPLTALQGIGDHAARSYANTRDQLTLSMIQHDLSALPSCPRLSSYWQFDRCGYRKGTMKCSEPGHMADCPLPRHDLRKGTLNQAAFGLALFLRDLANDDFVGFLDRRLAAADPGCGAPGRSALLREAVVEPLASVVGIGPKLAGMILSDILLGADPNRERWLAAGAGMAAVDTITHQLLHRTGVLRGLGATHRYGPACTGPRGCLSIIEAMAERFDARAIDPQYPAVFPRLLQVALWAFGAQQAWNVCNGHRIDDRDRCAQRFCPCFGDCERIALHAGGMNARS